MNTIYLVFEKPKNHIVGAYATLEETEFEILVNTSKGKYDANNIYLKKEENIPNHTYWRLISEYKRNDLWS